MLLKSVEQKGFRIRPTGAATRHYCTFAGQIYGPHDDVLISYVVRL